MLLSFQFWGQQDQPRNRGKSLGMRPGKTRRLKYMTFFDSLNNSYFKESSPHGKPMVKQLEICSVTLICKLCSVVYMIISTHFQDMLYCSNPVTLRVLIVGQQQHSDRSFDSYES